MSHEDPVHVIREAATILRGVADSHPEAAVRAKAAHLLRLLSAWTFDEDADTEQLLGLLSTAFGIEVRRTDNLPDTVVH